MSKTPPNRRGITFEVGAQLEARDSLKNWYAANIEKIDFDDEKVLIHYRQWSHRYDEWFDWTSPYLRPVERIQLRRQGLQDDAPVPVSAGFHVNDKVLASWSDCRFYPAKVLAVNKDASFTVKFYDGVVQTVKGIHVKPFVKEKRSINGGKSGSVQRKVQSGRDRRPPENGCPKNKRARRSTSDQEEEEEEESSGGSSSSSEDGDAWEGAPAIDKTKEHDGEAIKMEAPAIKREQEDSQQQPGRDRPLDTAKQDGLVNGVKAEEEEETEKKPDKSILNGEVKTEEMERELNGSKPYTEESKPYMEPTCPSPAQAEQMPVTMTTTEANGIVEQKLSSHLDKAKPAEEVPPPAQPVKSVRKQGFHNPNRFSREPLYRVIKNQPPPVLSINLDHNPFKCTALGCTKSFRKAKLLHYHMKYYHGDEQPLEGGLSPTRGIQTRASEKQTTASAETPKRRRTISASMHPGGPTPSSHNEARAMGRRTSAPPTVNSQGQQQRVLLRDKCKENQLESQQLERDAERSGFDIASMKERLKEKPKQKDFLRIKLKKRKKKKRAKSDEDSLSDWSTDSCSWSDEDFGVDLDVSSPPLSGDSVALDTSDQEIVRCVCEVEEENDFMIQCEECLCWQHGTCMGLLEENVPDKYACYICRDPPGQRQSLRYWYDREWLANGHMYGLSFLDDNYSHQNAKKIAATHQLLGDVHHVLEVLNGLQLKMNVLQSRPHPDLRLWHQPWRQSERIWKSFDSWPGSDGAPSPAAPDEDASRGEILMSNALEKLGRAAAAGGGSSVSSSSCSSSSSPPHYLSFRDSYISSEHCYQKPRAYYPAVERRLVVETRQGSELEDSMRSTEDLLEREQRYGGLLDVHRPKALNTSSKVSNAGRLSQAEVKEERGPGGGAVPDDSKQHQQWQLNLLDHIDTVQDEVSHRMDFIERELDVLESWLDYTGELEPPDPLARLPQLKHRVKKLLAELSKVQQISLCSST